MLAHEINTNVFRDVTTFRASEDYVHQMIIFRERSRATVKIIQHQLNIERQSVYQQRRARATIALLLMGRCRVTTLNPGPASLKHPIQMIPSPTQMNDRHEICMKNTTNGTTALQNVLAASNTTLNIRSNICILTGNPGTWDGCPLTITAPPRSESAGPKGALLKRQKIHRGSQRPCTAQQPEEARTHLSTCLLYTSDAADE